MIKRILTAGTLLLALVGIGGASVAHAGYPIGGCATVVTNQATVFPKATITITASGYSDAAIGMTITFYLIGTSADHAEGAVVVGTAVIAANHTASITIEAPKEFGSYDIIAVGGSCEDALTTFEVSGDFPRTGGQSSLWVQTAVELLVLGLGFVVVAFRRRRPAEAAA